MITGISQFSLNFQNQKIKWKGNSQIMNYQVIKGYNKIWSFFKLWNTVNDVIKALFVKKGGEVIISVQTHYVIPCSTTVSTSFQRGIHVVCL